MRRMMRTLLTAFSSLAIAGLPVMADARTESYVAENASAVLASLNDPALSQEDRSEKFNLYMDEFTDLNLISNFVIGKYARRFSDEDLQHYREAFRTYALAVYETELDKYRGEDIVVKGSTDRNPRDSIVDTVIRRADGKDMNVRWRVMTRNGEFQVIDVALNLDGNLVWLAIEQRAQFLALLDRTNGSADALIDKLQEMTASLNARKRADVSMVSNAG